MKFSNTGNGILISDPLGIYIDNIEVDVSRVLVFLESFQMQCNYPDANTTNTVYINNIRQSNSTKTHAYGRLVGSGLPLNHTISNIDCTRHISKEIIDYACSAYILFATCNPQDALPLKVDYHNYLFDGRYASEKNAFVLAVYFSVDIVHYRQIGISLTNFTYQNYNQVSRYGLHFHIGTRMDTSELQGFYFENMTCSLPILELHTFSKISLRNLTLEDNPTQFWSFMTIETSGDIEITGLSVTNYSNIGPAQRPFIDINCENTSTITLNNFVVRDMKLVNAPFLKTQEMPRILNITNIVMTDIEFDGSEFLFDFEFLGNFLISNITFVRVNPADKLDSEARVFNFRTILVDHMKVGEIKDIVIADSVFTLFKAINTLGLVTEQRVLSLQNIVYKNCVIPAFRALFTTQDFATSSNLQMTIEGIQFENINFTSRGSLMNLYHQLPNKVEISNCSVKNIRLGYIHIQGSANSEHEKTKVLFNQCEFGHLHLESSSFLAITDRSTVEVTNSSFSNITTLDPIVGVMSVEDKSNVSVNHATFKHNSGVASVLFKVTTESRFHCGNCIVTNNFGLQNGLFSVESFGVIEISHSQIYSNFGVQGLLGNILLGVEPCVIRNTSISKNILIPKSEISNEISTECTRLCFLSTEIKEYLTENDLGSIAEKEYLLEVVQANLEITDLSSISSQAALINSFLSTIEIRDCNITDIPFEVVFLSIVSSTLWMENCDIINAQKGSLIDHLITVNSGIANLKKINYKNSNAQLLNSFDSEVSFEGLALINSTLSKNLLQISYSSSFRIQNITLLGSQFESEFIVAIKNTRDIIIEDIQLTMLNSTFVSLENCNVTRISNLKTSKGTQALKFISSDIEILSNSWFFQNDVNESGGAISLQDSIMSMFNCTFSNNSAVIGGAIQFHCTDNSHCALEIDNSHFESNSAVEMGGAIHYNYNKPTVINTHFINNSAKYGNDLASYPTRVGLVNSSIDDEIILNNIGPGITIDTPIELALLDMDGQVMNLDNKSTIIILPKDPAISSIRGTNVILLENGIASFDSISMQVRREYKTAKFSIASKSIDTAKVAKALSNNFTQVDLVANFRDCKPGEQILGDACTECPTGKFSLNWNSTECSDCYDNANCLGGNQVSLSSGYWRRFQNSTKIVKCINKKACAGGYSNNTIVPTDCAEGYTGNLCSQCIITEDLQYQRVNDFECTKCPNPVLNFIQVIGVMLLVFGFFIVLTIINVKKTTESRLSVLLRIFTNYLQLMTVSISMSDEYPSAVVSIFIPINTFGGSADAFMSFDCFITESEGAGPFGSNAIFKLFLLSFLPLILSLAISMIWVILYFVRRSWVKDLKRNIIISFITVVFILHPKLAERSISMFRCVEIDEVTQVARIDTDIGCYSYAHLKWLLLVSVPIIIIWVTACPLIALVLIYKSKKSGESSKIQSYFLTMYQGLKPNAVYWEFVNTLRKMLILISLIMQTTQAIFISLSVLIVTSRLQVYISPYKNEEYSKIEYMAMMSGILTIIVALVYSQADQIGWISTLILFSILLANIKFLLGWTYCVLEIYQTKISLVQTVNSLIKL